MISKTQIENLVYQNTPIDTIISTNEFCNGIEVKGYSGNKNLTFRIYENGKVVKL